MLNRLLYIFILISVSVHSQETVTIKNLESDKDFIEEFEVLKADQKTKHGCYFKFTRNGTLLEESHFKNNLKDSSYKAYYLNGKPKCIGEFNKGKKSGIWSFYDHFGVKIQKYDFDNRKLIYTSHLRPRTKSIQSVVQGDSIVRKEISKGPLPIGDEFYFTEELQNSISVPQEALKNRVYGTVYIQFVVTKEGKSKDYKVTEKIGYGCDEEALRALKLFENDWIPGENSGSPVDVVMVAPILFDLK